MKATWLDSTWKDAPTGKGEKHPEGSKEGEIGNPKLDL